MNHTTFGRQEQLSLNQGRLRSIATDKFERLLKFMMLIASIFRLDCVHGFFSRARPSICTSLHPRHARSIAASPATIMTATHRIGTRSSVPFKFQSSSRIAMSMSTSASCIEKSLGGNFHSISLSIPTMETMEEVGALIAIISKQTDVLFLDGDLGAGKTTFSRGFIKCKLGVADDGCDDNESDDSEDTAGARVGQASLRITSPTYLLSNTYEYREDDDYGEEDKANGEPTKEIHHMDLYRLSGKSPRDFSPLDLGYVFSNCISLIEWPSRLQAFPELLPPEETLLKINIRIPDPTSDERVMSLVSSSESSWSVRLKYLIDEGMVDDLLLHADDEPENSNDDDSTDGIKD